MQGHRKKLRGGKELENCVIYLQSAMDVLEILWATPVAMPGVQGISRNTKYYINSFLHYE
jgi:hypothetical protein